MKTLFPTQFRPVWPKFAPTNIFVVNFASASSYVMFLPIILHNLQEK